MGKRKVKFTYRKNEERKRHERRMLGEKLPVSIPLDGIVVPGHSTPLSLPVSLPLSVVQEFPVESACSLRLRLGFTGLPLGK